MFPYSSSQPLSKILGQLFDEKIERFTLPNGLTVVFKQDCRCKLASIQVWVKTGSIYENNYLGSGLSHFIEHMLFKGTQQRAGSEISCQIQKAGGHFNAYTTFDRTVYYIDLPSEKAALAFDILGDMTFNSLLPEEEIKKERNVILREIDMYLDDPSTQVSEMLFHNAFRLHPYRHPIIGYRQLFEANTKEDLKNYYREKYVPNNTVLVISGNLENQIVHDLAERYFAHYPRQRLLPSLIAEEPEQLASRQERRIGNVQICRGVMGFKIPSFSHPDAPLLDILALILGNGHSSVLWQKLREEKQLAHSIEVDSWNPGSIGLFCISYCCNPDKCEAVEEAILKEIQAVFQNGFEDKQIEKALRQTIINEIGMRKTVSGQASRQGFYEVVLGDFGYPRRYFERLYSITPKDLQPVIEKYLASHQMTVVSLNAPQPATQSGILKKDQDKQASELEVITLENGVRLIIQNDSSLPKIHLRATFRGGSLYENTTHRGVTALTAKLLTADTQQRAAHEVAEIIENAGASLDEFYGNNVFGLATEILPQDLSLGLECLTQGLLEPAFTQERINLERNNLIDQIKENEDEIIFYGMTHLRHIFFGAHPLNTIPEGNPTSLQAIDLSVIKETYEKLITATNCVFAIAGDFDPEKDIKALKTSLQNFPTSDFQESNIDFPAPPHPGYHEIKLPREQIVLFQAYPAPGMKEEDFIVGEILEEIFSEMSGNLFTQIREERGLAYFVSANRVVGWNTGMFFLYAGTHQDTYTEVLKQMDVEIKRVKEGQLSEDELTRCQNRLKAQKQMSLQTLHSRMALASGNVLCGLSANTWQDYDHRIEAITLKRIQTFAQKYFMEENKVVLIVKP